MAQDYYKPNARTVATFPAMDINVTILLSLFVCLLGGIIYFITDKAKPMEIARLCFACGLLVFLFQVTGRALHLSN